MLVSEIITTALTKIGVVPVGETVATAHSTIAFNELNDMLQEWAVDGLLFYATTLATVSTVNAQASYTIGAGGNFNVRRPVEIIDAVLTVSAGVYRRLEVWNQLFRYRAYTARPSGSPTELFYDPQFPLGTLIFYPTPNAIFSVDLVAWTPTAPFTAVGDTVALPPEYQAPLGLNLGARLLPIFGKSDALLIEQAKECKAVLSASNSKRFVRVECPHPHLARNHFCHVTFSGAR